MLGYKKGNTKLLTGQIPLHYPGDRVYLDGDPTKTVQDKCARKADLTNLDLTGTTNTTGSTISSGTFFYLNGTLVRAKTAIANGDTLTANTNYEVVSAGGLNELIKVYSTSVSTGAGTSISISLYKSGKVVYIKFANGAYTASADATLATIPNGFRPIAGADFRDTYSNKRISITEAGNITCNEALSSTPLRGTFCYITN